MLKRLFKQGKSEVDPSDDLPASLEASIEGMNVVFRGHIDDVERTLLCFAGEQMASWYHSETETRKRLSAGWPGLSDIQLTQALRAIQGKIRASMRKAAPARKKSSWSQWKPLRQQLFENDYE